MRNQTLARIVLFLVALTLVTSHVFAKNNKSAQKERTTIYVTDLHCKKCVKKIARKLYAVPKVVKVQTNLKKDFVVVIPERGKQIPPSVLWDAAVEAGFKPVKLISPVGTFTKHPDSPKARQG